VGSEPGDKIELIMKLCCTYLLTFTTMVSRDIDDVAPVVVVVVVVVDESMTSVGIIMHHSSIQNIVDSIVLTSCT